MVKVNLVFNVFANKLYQFTCEILVNPLHWSGSFPHITVLAICKSTWPRMISFNNNLLSLWAVDENAYVDKKRNLIKVARLQEAWFLI